MSLVISKVILKKNKVILKKNTDTAVADFSSLTFSGPFLNPSEGWSIGTAGAVPYGVGIKYVGVDEPTHDASRSIM